MEGSTATLGSNMNTALMKDVNPNQIGTQFIEILPWVGVMMVVAFMLYEVKKLIKGGSKGKVRV